MKKAVASRARRRTHRRGGQEQQGPPTGERWGTDREAGAWWGLYFDGERSEPSCCANSGPALVTTTQRTEPRMIAGRAHYTPARPLEIPGGESREHPHPLPALPVRY